MATRVMPGSTESLTINAWTGHAGATGGLHDAAGTWGVKQHLPRQVNIRATRAAAEPVDLRDWRHPAVGWGLVLPDSDALPHADRARATDASPSIQKLLASRPGSPVFRYRPDMLPGFLRRYYADGSARDFALSGSARGIGAGQLPWYLLIAGPPSAIPWRVQYLLNSVSFTGRLDLDEEASSRYVEALIDHWQGAAVSSNRPVVWAVDHGEPDITWLMRGTIADPIATRMREDPQIGDSLSHFAGPTATAGALAQALATAIPSFIVTTSHGLTSPLDDPERMRRQLGLPVDAGGAVVMPETLLSTWQPDGAIWYAHACCSAGSDSGTSYKGLVTEGSSVEETLEAVGALGAGIAPLPRALLGAKKPARAFVGQVEPTFNYTLRNPENRQVVTASLQKALYDHMFRAQPEPVGMALANAYRHVGELFAQWEQLVRGERAGAGARDAALRTLLMAIDRQSMVILGDPTVALPRLL